MDLLRSLKLSDVPASPHGVITLSGSDTLNQAFQTLVKNDILGAPVINKKQDSHSFKVIDLVDLVRFVVDLYSEDERLFEHDLHEMMAKSGTKETNKVFTVQHVADLSHFDPCVPVAEGADLSKVADALSTGLHRVIVVDHDGNLKNIITQSAIIDLLWKHRKQLGDLLEQSLFELNLGAKEVAVVKTSDLAIDAFRKIVDKKISAVGVINHEGVLVGNVSARDLRHSVQSATKSKETVKNLYSVVTEFLAYKNLDAQSPATAITCRPTDKFGYLLEKIHENRIHRVYIVNDQHHPVGVVSLKDILDLFSRLDTERMKVKAETVLHQTTSAGPNV